MDFLINQAVLNEVLPTQLQALFNEAIVVSSTVFEDVDPESSERVFIGSKTETALLMFAKELGWAAFHETRDTAEGGAILQQAQGYGCCEAERWQRLSRLPEGCK